MLNLTNREELIQSAQLTPLIEEIALCISPETGVRAIAVPDNPCRALPGWIVYADGRNCGIALHPLDTVPAASVLRRRLSYLCHAQKLAKCFGARRGDFPLHLQEATTCPPEWHVFRVTVRAGDILCAVSLPTPELSFCGLRQAHLPSKALVRLQAYVEWSQSVSIGAAQTYPTVPTIFPDQELRGTLYISEEGTMTVTTEALEVQGKESSQTNLPIRVDLGEVELSLEQIAALRVGSKLELDVVFPMRCYLRISSTTLGTGEISQTDNGLRIELREIFA